MAENPHHLRIAYNSYFLIQLLSTILLTTLHQSIFPDPSLLTDPMTVFFIRGDAGYLFPFISLVWLLRDNHVSTPVGKKVAVTFALANLWGLGLVGWTWLSEGWIMEGWRSSLILHGLWGVSGIVALAGY
jgi:hypothetical protein